MAIELNDSEMSVLLELSRPVEPAQRTAFMAEVAQALETSGTRGEGAVHRVARTIQRRFFDPPEFPNLTAPVHRGSKVAADL
jgi:hypothetical protein